MKTDRTDVEAWTRTTDGRACFLSWTRRQGEHTVWKGQVRDGSPTWRVGRFDFSARQVMAQLSGVRVPDDFDVARTCDVERCLTHVEVVKGHNAAKTHCVNDHALTDDNLVPSVTHERRCLACHRKQSREAAVRYRARKRAQREAGK
ncbi:hypothetical protein AQJ23_45200 [Streptomyces antibioticus]|nr:hypothetical protein AQJ23_45200 [Streptomyces antibioticus]